MPKNEAIYLEGIKGVREAIERDGVVEVLVSEGREEEPGISEVLFEARTKRILTRKIGKKEQKSIGSTTTFPGIAARLRPRLTTREKLLSLNNLVFLDGVADPGNAGTIIRTALWFGISGFVFGENCVFSGNEKLIRSTMGAWFRAQILETKNIIEELAFFKQNKYHISAFELSGRSLTEFIPQDKNIYIFGSESHGVSSQISRLSDERLSIEGERGVESLNVASAASIAFYHHFLSQKRFL